MMQRATTVALRRLTNICVSQPFQIRAELRRIAPFYTQKIQTVEWTVNDSLSRVRVKLSDA